MSTSYRGLARTTKIADLSAIRREKATQTKPEANVRFYILGRMRALAPGGEDILPRGRKLRALLAYLCLAQGEPVTRSRIISLLWDRSADPQAQTSLRKGLSELTRSVNSVVPGLIEYEGRTVRVNSKMCWVDALAVPDQPERLLEDFDGISPSFDQWLTAERTRFEDRSRAALESELERLTEEGSAAELRAAAARRLINFEPTHEGAVRSLMTAFVEMGDRAQAIREFERCREALQRMLDLPPSKETVALYEALRLVSSGKPALVIPRDPVSVVSDEDALTPGARATPDNPHQPSIAVLPFRNLSTERGHDYTAEGLVEDLVEALSRVPNFFVISRLSTLAFRDQNRLPQEVGDVLGVRYVISGSMRVAGDHLRLSVELTDTRNGAALWCSRLDERFFDLIEVQERLAEGIVRRVAPYLHAVELKRAHITRPDRLNAYDLFLRAQENMHNSTRVVFESSERLFDAAIERNPRYATALAWRAYWHVLRVGQGWSPDPVRDAELADHFAHRAVECDSMETMALAVHGHIASYLHKDFDLAFQRFETALRINRNAAPAWLWSAAAHAWIGKGARAVEEINTAIALSPYDPLMYAYSGIAAMAYLADGQFERAAECALRSIQENRTYTTAYKILVLALMLGGRESEARSPTYQLLKLEPELTVEGFRRQSPSSAGPYGDLYCDAFARAGIPLKI